MDAQLKLRCGHPTTTTACVTHMGDGERGGGGGGAQPCTHAPATVVVNEYPRLGRRHVRISCSSLRLLLTAACASLGWCCLQVVDSNDVEEKQVFVEFWDVGGSSRYADSRPVFYQVTVPRSAPVHRIGTVWPLGRIHHCLSHPACHAQMSCATPFVAPGLEYFGSP